MVTRSDVFAEEAFGIAWALFCQLHDVPSRDHADQLVTWLGEDPRNARALDDALTLWAFAGAAMAEPRAKEAARTGKNLQ